MACHTNEIGIKVGDLVGRIWGEFGEVDAHIVYQLISGKMNIYD